MQAKHVTDDEKSNPTEIKLVPGFFCAICLVTFKDKRYLKNHNLYKHSDARPFSCDAPSCDYMAKTRGDLNIHRNIHMEHKDKKFACRLCSFWSQQGFKLKVHMLANHGTDECFCCDTCKETFVIYKEYQKHLATH